MNTESALGYSPKELERIPNYILYIKMLEQINENFDNMNQSLLNLIATQTYLNKNMENIAESLRAISLNNR